MSRPYTFRIVDVFASPEGGGNQLAVLPDAQNLSTEDMQAIAREFNFAETTFVFPPGEAASYARFRIFTPSREMPFAGHPTLGGAAVVAPHDLPSSAALIIEEPVGLVNVTVEPSTQDAQFVALSLDGTLHDVPEAPHRDLIARCLGLPSDLVHQAWFASVGMPFCFAELTSPYAVDQAELDLAQWREHLADTYAPQIYLFATDDRPGAHVQDHPDRQLYARMFAPGLGVAEDAATGSAAATLAGSLQSRLTHDASCPRRLTLRIRQGQRFGRPSDLIATASVDHSGTRNVGVGGSVRHFASGVLEW